MNEKTCKRLRRKSEELSIGMPYRSLVGKRVMKAKKDENGCPVFAIYVINDPNSTRGIYRSLKRDAS